MSRAPSPDEARRAAETAGADPLAWAHIIDWHQAWDAKPDQTEWLIEPLLERGTLNAWFGKPAASKSLIALEAAAALAAGRPILGYPAQDPVTVLYLDVENAVNDIVERLEAFGYQPGDLKQLVYSSFPDVPGLDTAAGGQFLLSAAEAHNPALVIIDTTSRIIAGKENDADTFLQLYRNALVPLKQRGITVLRLDHPGKDLDRGQRGSSAKDGDVDTVWLVDQVSQTGINFERRKSPQRARRRGRVPHSQVRAAPPRARRHGRATAGRRHPGRARPSAGTGAHHQQGSPETAPRSRGTLPQRGPRPGPPPARGWPGNAGERGNAGSAERRSPFPTRSGGTGERSIPGTAMTAPKRVRAMKARRASTLACGHHVTVGTLIVRVGGRWICATCRRAAIRGERQRREDWQ